MKYLLFHKLNNLWYKGRELNSSDGRYTNKRNEAKEFTQLHEINSIINNEAFRLQLKLDDFEIMIVVS